MKCLHVFSPLVAPAMSFQDTGEYEKNLFSLCSPMLERASSSRVTRSLGSRGSAMMLSLFALLHPHSALRAVRGSGVA